MPRYTIEFEGKIQGLATAVDQLKARFDTFAQTTAQATQNVQKNFDELGKKIEARVQSVSGSMLRWGAAIGAIATGGGLAALTQKAGEFQVALADVNTILEKGAPAIEKWGDAVRSLAKGSTRDVVDLTKGLYDAISSGAEQTLAAGGAFDLLAKAQKAATAGLSTTSDAVRAGAAVMNIYGKEAGTTEQIFDKLLQAVASGMIRFPELAKEIGGLSTKAKAANVGFEEMLAALVEVSKGMGGNVAEAATALGALFTSLSAPGMRADKIIEGIGINLSKQAIAEKGLLGVIQDTQQKLNAAYGDSASIQRRLLQSQEARVAFDIISRNNAEAYTKSLDAQGNAVGNLNRMYAIQEQTATAQMQKLKNQFNDLAIAVKEGLGKDSGGALKAISDAVASVDAAKVVKFLKDVIDAVASLAKHLYDLRDSIKVALEAFLAWKALNAIFGTGGSLLAGFTSLAAKVGDFKFALIGSLVTGQGWIPVIGQIAAAFGAAAVAGHFLGEELGRMATRVLQLDRAARQAAGFAREQEKLLSRGYYGGEKERLEGDIRAAMRSGSGTSRAENVATVRASRQAELATMEADLTAKHEAVAKADRRLAALRAAMEGGSTAEFPDIKPYQPEARGQIEGETKRRDKMQAETLAFQVEVGRRKELLGQFEGITAKIDREEAEAAQARAKRAEDAAREQAEIDRKAPKGEGEDEEDSLENEIVKRFEHQAYQGMMESDASAGVDWQKIRRDRLRSEREAREYNERVAVQQRRAMTDAEVAAAQEVQGRHAEAYARGGLVGLALSALGTQSGAPGGGAAHLFATEGISGGLTALGGANILSGLSRVMGSRGGGGLMGAGEMLVGAAQVAGAKFYDLIKGAGEFLYDKLAGLVGQAGSMRPGEFKASLSQQFRDANYFVDNLVKNLPVLFERLGPFIDKIGPKIADALPKIFGALERGLPVVLRAVLAQLPKIVDALIDELPRLIDSLVGMLPMLIERLINLAITKSGPLAVAIVRGFVQAFVAHAGEIVQAIVDGITGGLTGGALGRGNPIGSIASKGLAAISTGGLSLLGGLFEHGGVVPAIQSFAAGGVVQAMRAHTDATMAALQGNGVLARVHPGEPVLTRGSWKKIEGALVDSVLRGTGAAPPPPLIVQITGKDGPAVDKLISARVVRQARREGSPARSMREVAGGGFANLPGLTPLIEGT